MDQNIVVFGQSQRFGELVVDVEDVVEEDCGDGWFFEGIEEGDSDNIIFINFVPCFGEQENTSIFTHNQSNGSTCRKIII